MTFAQQQTRLHENLSTSRDAVADNLEQPFRETFAAMLARIAAIEPQPISETRSYLLGARLGLSIGYRVKNSVCDFYYGFVDGMNAEID